MKFDCRNCSYSLQQHIGSKYKCPGEGVEGYLVPWDGSPVPTDRLEQEDALREENARLRKALEDIVRHQDLMGGTMVRFSSIRMIAKNALEEPKDTQ